MRSDGKATYVHIGEVIDHFIKDGTIDRLCNATEPTSIIHNYTSGEEDRRIIKAYLDKHYSLLTTAQIRELDEIFAESEKSKNERNAYEH